MPFGIIYVQWRDRGGGKVAYAPPQLWEEACRGVIWNSGAVLAAEIGTSPGGIADT